MSQELLYTSAPRGLKPGSRGFCTVLSTQGMPAPLATAVEALSGYRPVYPSSDERSARNPIVYSHLKMQATGKSWHVLSRIADYGLDYSQRPNKLAHHVILDKPSEKLSGGPANLLTMPGFMREGWQGEPEVVALKPITREHRSHSGVCERWREMTGDAGWAGVLAESFLNDPERLVILLFEPGQEILPLFAEAISLLPVERRWDVTFSTYFTNLAAGTTCVWRGMVHDSKEARESLRFVHAIRLDLTINLADAATGGDLVEVARGAGHSISSPIDVMTQFVVADDNRPQNHDVKITAGEKGRIHETREPHSTPTLAGECVRVTASPPSLVPKSRRQRSTAIISTSIQWRFPHWTLATIASLIILCIGAAIRTTFLAATNGRTESKVANSTAQHAAVSVSATEVTREPVTTLVAKTNDSDKTKATSTEQDPSKPTNEGASNAIQYSGATLHNQLTTDTSKTQSPNHTSNKPTVGPPSQAMPQAVASNVKTSHVVLCDLPDERKSIVLYEFQSQSPLQPNAKPPSMRLFAPSWLPYTDGEANTPLQKAHGALWAVNLKATEGLLPFAVFTRTEDHTTTRYRLTSLISEHVKWLGWYRLRVVSSGPEERVLREIKFTEFPVLVAKTERTVSNEPLRWPLPKSAVISPSRMPLFTIDRLSISIGDRNYSPVISGSSPGSAQTFQCTEFTSHAYAKADVKGENLPQLQIDIKICEIKEDTCIEVTLLGKTKVIHAIKTSIESQLAILSTELKTTFGEFDRATLAVADDEVKSKVENKFKSVSLNSHSVGDARVKIQSDILDAVKKLERIRKGLLTRICG